MTSRVSSYCVTIFELTSMAISGFCTQSWFMFSRNWFTTKLINLLPKLLQNTCLVAQKIQWSALSTRSSPSVSATWIKGRARELLSLWAFQWGKGAKPIWAESITQERRGHWASPPWGRWGQFSICELIFWHFFHRPNSVAHTWLNHKRKWTCRQCVMCYADMYTCTR